MVTMLKAMEEAGICSFESCVVTGKSARTSCGRRLDITHFHVICLRSAGQTSSW